MVVIDQQMAIELKAEELTRESKDRVQSEKKR